MKTPDSVRQKQRRQRLKNGQQAIRATVPTSLTTAFITMGWLHPNDAGDATRVGQATADYAYAAFKKLRHSVTRTR